MSFAGKRNGGSAAPTRHVWREQHNATDWEATLEEARRENERAANRDAAVFLLSYIVLNLAIRLMLVVNYSVSLNMVTAYFFVPLCVVLFVCILVAVYFKFDRPWIKHMLLTGIVVVCAAAYFFYANLVSCFFVLPVVISMRYLNKRLVRNIAIITFVVFVFVIAGNLYLEDTSEIFQFIHDANGYNPWESILDAVAYVVVPFVFALVYVVYFAARLTEAGRRFIDLRAKASARVAAVEAELGMAAEIQRTTLPAESFETRNGNFALTAREIPAREVGGDFYDYYMANEHTLCVLVADVSDKGVPAALFMMSAKKALESAVDCCTTLTEAVELATRLICRDNEREMFLTLWIGMVDIRTGKGKYANAGHLPPVLRRATGATEWLECEPDLFIGNFPDMPPAVHSFELKAGDTLVLYTDGVTDAENASGGRFGASGLMRAVQAAPSHSRGLCTGVVESVQHFSEGSVHFDDMTVLALECIRVDELRTLQRAVAATYDGAEVLVSTVDELLRDLSCADEARRKTGIIVDEVASNIVENAYGDEGAGTMELTAQAGGNFIDVQMVDYGAAFDPLAQEDPQLDDEPQIGGFGIYFVRELADEVRYERKDGANVLSFRVIWNS